MVLFKMSEGQSLCFKTIVSCSFIFDLLRRFVAREILHALHIVMCPSCDVSLVSCDVFLATVVMCFPTDPLLQIVIDGSRHILYTRSQSGTIQVWGTHTQTHAHTRTHAYTHMHTHTHMYTHIQTHTCTTHNTIIWPYIFHRSMTLD